MIQDLSFAIGSLILIAALVPSLRKPEKPAFLTSIITGNVLVVFGVTHLTLDLYFAAVTSFITGFLWFVLAWQEHCRQRALNQLRFDFEEAYKTNHGRVIILED